MATDHNTEVWHPPARQSLCTTHELETEERRFHPWPSDEYCKKAKQELASLRRTYTGRPRGPSTPAAERLGKGKAK